MKCPAFLAATPLALALVATPVAADDGLCRNGISAEEAIRIARGAGVVRVQDVDCDDGKWEVEGRDAQGRKIEVDVHAGDGRVLDVDRDD
jgi:uncharacterized membrane protein YkoI